MEFVCFVWISEITANFALYNIKSSVFITEVESVNCAMRSESLYNTGILRLLKCNRHKKSPLDHTAAET